jgi:hypothetical protein
MTMKLITEQNDTIITETVSTPTGKDYYVQGIFLQANIENRNGRIYPLEILVKEVARYNEVYVSQRRAMSELGHPEGPTINLERVSHLITDLYQEGTNFIGKAKILDTPFGKIAKNFIDEGIKLGTSSRGMGSLKENANGVQVVQADFTIMTAGDLVSDPSAPAAFLQGIREGKEWIWNNGTLVERTCEKIKKQITNKFNEKGVLESFEKYLDALAKSPTSKL